MKWLRPATGFDFARWQDFFTDDRPAAAAAGDHLNYDQYMPELPDLQAFSRNLNKTLKGRTVTALRVRARKATASEKAFRQAIVGHAISGIRRDGKQLHIQFDNNNVLALHLMLHGGLALFSGSNESRHTIMELLFDNGTGLAVTDWQKAATPSLNPKTSAAPDALSPEVNATFWKKQLKGRAAIKKVLLDQQVIRGIGNAYADEILWKAGISPFSVANKLPPKKITALSRAIRSVLKDAEKQILRSHPDIISGEIRDFLNIHNAKKKVSPTGSPIKQQVVGGRKTYYTDEQELFQ